MSALARLSTAALVLTYLHLVFGGIVRISGSGMGCGDHWPKCNGSWIPPFNDLTVMIEWTHRLLALLVVLSIASLALVARHRRTQAGIGGRGGVHRPAILALALVIAVALLGMVTVKLGNTTMATVAHWTLALALLAVIIVTAVRAGALGGSAARTGGGTSRATRSLGAGAALAFLTVVLGGLVAKFPGAAVACRDFPLCGAVAADIPAGASHVQLTHRVLAYFLFFHVLAVTMAVSRRSGESASATRAAKAAAGLVVLQLALGAAMVLSMLPPVLRSLHQAVGIGVWLTMFLAAYLARSAEMS
jgi:cytochrome c oxidase assembly protein subunit 15